MALPWGGSLVEFSHLSGSQLSFIWSNLGSRRSLLVVLSPKGGGLQWLVSVPWRVTNRDGTWAQASDRKSSSLHHPWSSPGAPGPDCPPGPPGASGLTEQFSELLPICFRAGAGVGTAAYLDRSTAGGLASWPKSFFKIISAWVWIKWCGKWEVYLFPVQVGT